MDRKSSIGVFDSGLGGLTVVKELLNILPNENIIYFGDTGRVPYGSRSDGTILKYGLQDIEFLITHDVKIIVAACGTVSSIFANNNVDATSFNRFLYTGVLSPTVREAVSISRNGKIGILGTAATINSGAYRKYIMEMNPELYTTSIACPLFVPLVENGIISPDNIIVKSTVEMYLNDLKSEGIDTLILGCTHYPLLEEAISRFMGDSVRLINPGVQTAKFVREYLSNNDMLNDTEESGYCKFFASDDVNNFKKIANIFLGNEDFDEFNLVNLDSLGVCDTGLVKKIC